MADTPSPTLTLRTHRNEDMAVIEVKDNGHGIHPDHMQRLFEPFFTTKPIGKGTGLGLFISYSLVQKQGGNISASSKQGQGAVFSIRLPIKQSSQDREQSEPAIGISEKV
jgi:signal transduction histidine kinase